VNDAPVSPVAKDRLAALQSCQVPLAIALVCIALSLGGDVLQELARYERAGLVRGELWRLVGAHLVHLGWGHVALNIAALGVLAWLFEAVLDRLDWLAVVLASALGIDVGLYWLASDVEWYVGMSGVLHGIMAAGSVKLLVSRAPSGLLLLLLTTAKLSWEQWGGPLPYSEATSGGPVITEAHLYGAVSGIVGLFAAWIVRRRRFPPL